MATIDVTTRQPAFVEIMSRRDAILDDVKTALMLYGENVRAELDAIATVPHDLRRASALAFAILSPQADFTQNVNAVRPLIDSLLRNDDETTTLSAIRSVGYCMTNAGKYSQYVRSRDLILFAQASDMTLANVSKHAGFGLKTSSMGIALYNEWARVCTLDTWMLNGFLGTAASGKDKNANTYTASGPAYHAIADMFLSIADELNVSPFLAQWATWCYYRGKGFDSHLAIFGL